MGSPNDLPKTCTLSRLRHELRANIVQQSAYSGWIPATASAGNQLPVPRHSRHPGQGLGGAEHKSHQRKADLSRQNILLRRVDQYLGRQGSAACQITPGPIALAQAVAFSPALGRRPVCSSRRALPSCLRARSARIRPACEVACGPRRSSAAGPGAERG